VQATAGNRAAATLVQRHEVDGSPGSAGTAGTAEAAASGATNQAAAAGEHKQNATSGETKQAATPEKEKTKGAGNLSGYAQGIEKWLQLNLDPLDKTPDGTPKSVTNHTSYTLEFLESDDGEFGSASIRLKGPGGFGTCSFFPSEWAGDSKEWLTNEAAKLMSGADGAIQSDERGGRVAREHKIEGPNSYKDARNLALVANRYQNTQYVIGSRDCATFANEAWHAITGEKLEELTPKEFLWLPNAMEMGDQERKNLHKQLASVGHDQVKATFGTKPL
jgi:hypothetical protein